MDIHVFLAHTVKLEFETEEAYLKLEDLMTKQDNRDVAEFFREMASFSRLHGKAAMERAGFDDTTDIHGIIDSWSGSGASEIPDMKNFSSPVDLDGAMAQALATERHGVIFYEDIARTTPNSETRLLAEKFAEEERGHVLALERFFGLKPY
jgi:rubrerythrin